MCSFVFNTIMFNPKACLTEWVFFKVSHLYELFHERAFALKSKRLLTKSAFVRFLDGMTPCRLLTESTIRTLKCLSPECSFIAGLIRPSITVIGTRYWTNVCARSQYSFRFDMHDSIRQVFLSGSDIFAVYSTLRNCFENDCRPCTGHVASLRKDKKYRLNLSNYTSLEILYPAILTFTRLYHLIPVYTRIYPSIRD